MMWSFRAFAALVVLPVLSHALVYAPDQVGFNLNENQTATSPLDCKLDSCVDMLARSSRSLVPRITIEAGTLLPIANAVI